MSILSSQGPNVKPKSSVPQSSPWAVIELTEFTYRVQVRGYKEEPR